MYYECSWVGTQFERLEHSKCADELLFNPQHFRCDDVTVFRLQFAHGNLSADDLMGFIRFQNCLTEQSLFEDNIDNPIPKLKTNVIEFYNREDYSEDQSGKVFENFAHETKVQMNDDLDETDSTTPTTPSVSMTTTETEENLKFNITNIDVTDLLGSLKIFLENNTAKSDETDISGSDLKGVSPQTTVKTATQNPHFAYVKKLLSLRNQKIPHVAKRSDNSLDEMSLGLRVKNFSKHERKPIKFSKKLKKLNSSLSVNDELTGKRKSETKEFRNAKSHSKPIDLGYDGKQLFEMDKIKSFADPLITCKDNDFGLECSCSVQLKPQKCKQLVNSFLTSCRIVGCKNSGRCINMAYKYPIPYMCSCPSAYTGNYCEKYRYDSDNCKDTCKNSGVCEVSNGTARCNCKNTNFTGEFCETVVLSQPTSQKKMRLGSNALSVIDCAYECGSSDNRGHCVLSLNGIPKCICDRGWTGANCSVVEHCVECLNNSTCTNNATSNTYFCACKPGYTGAQCETFIQQSKDVRIGHFTDPCTLIRCSNDGICQSSYSNTNHYSFQCICKPGYHGLLCEIEENPCDKNPCNTTDYVCVSTGFQSYICLCINSKTNCSTIQGTNHNATRQYLSSKIETQTNTSASKIPYYRNPCLNDPELCLKSPYGNQTFACLKRTDGHECVFRETKSCARSPCLNNASCLSDYNSSAWECVCGRGYTGVFCETKLCSEAYKTLKNHTMCALDSKDYQNGSLNFVDSSLILELHNLARSQTTPNMQKVYWDMELQHYAQKTAQTCRSQYSDMISKQLPGYGDIIYEKISVGLGDWTQVIESWKNESLYQTQNPNNNMQVACRIERKTFKLFDSGRICVQDFARKRFKNRLWFFKVFEYEHFYLLLWSGV
jgi:hypothetical protein